MRMRRLRLFLSTLVFLPLVTATAQMITSVANGASFIPDELAPGSIAAIFGTNLSSTTAQATTAAWPTTLGDVSIFVNGVAAPVYYVSPTQINFLVPNNVLAGCARGNKGSWRNLRVCLQASMGPRACARGNWNQRSRAR